MEEIRSTIEANKLVTELRGRQRDDWTECLWYMHQMVSRKIGQPVPKIPRGFNAVSDIIKERARAVNINLGQFIGDLQRAMEN